MNQPNSSTYEQELLDQEIARREKLERLRGEGTDPYPPLSKRSHSIAEAAADY